LKLIFLKNVIAGRSADIRREDEERKIATKEHGGHGGGAIIITALCELFLPRIFTLC
jgi:hypothetical protein